MSRIQGVILCYLYIIYTYMFFFAIRVRNMTVWFAAILHETYVIGSVLAGALYFYHELRDESSWQQEP